MAYIQLKKNLICCKNIFKSILIETLFFRIFNLNVFTFVFSSVFLEYEKDVTIQGIPALRFVTPERLFESPLVNPDNMCYCTEEKYCALSGILDVSPCRKGNKKLFLIKFYSVLANVRCK